MAEAMLTSMMRLLAEVRFSPVVERLAIVYCSRSWVAPNVEAAPETALIAASISLSVDEVPSARPDDGTFSIVHPSPSRFSELW